MRNDQNRIYNIAHAAVMSAGAAMLTVSFLANNSASAATGDKSLISGSDTGSYLAGRHAQFQHDQSKAADYYLSVLKRDPKNPDLLRRASILLTSTGRVPEGHKLAERLLVVTTENTDLARLSLSIREAKTERYEAAAEQLKSLPETGLNLFALPLIRAWLLVGRGEIDEALATIEKRMNNQGVAVLYGAHLGLINDIAKRPEQAAEKYQAVAKLREQPNLRLTQLLGAFYERNGRVEEAKALYDTYMAANPDTTMLESAINRLKTGAAPPSPITATDGLAEALFSLAGSLRQRDDIGTSLFARLALYLKPDFSIAKVLVAEILESNRRREDAIKVYQSVDPKSPFGWTARLRIASNFDALEKTSEAIRTLRAMARERNDRFDSLVSLGDILRRHERYREAAAAYTDAKARIPEIKKRHWTLLYASGISHERLKEWPKAESDFLKALELEPEQPFVLNYLGYSWVELGKNLARARKMIERAVARRPRDGYIVDSLGWVLYQLDDMDGAVKHMERAVELRPEDPVINDHLGDVYWKANRRNEARFQWQRALSLEPEKKLIPLIKKKLKDGPPAKKK